MIQPVDIEHWRTALTDSPRPDIESEMIELIAELEHLKATACAVQAQLAVALDDATRRREADAGVPAARRGRGVAAQVALARQESPQRGQILLGLARDLHADLPHTLQAMAEGRLSEYRALLVARESGCLETSDRRDLDAAVCGDPDVLDGLGTRQLVGELRRRVYATDPAAVVRRHRRAESERAVSLRPAPDTMTYLTALLPVAQGVAAYAALTRDADTIRVCGDDRTRSQVMADLLVERLTGQSQATAVPVTIDLVVSDAALLGAGHEPATLPGWGPVPAQIARELVVASLDSDCPTWLRQLYTDPAGRLVATTSRQRFAPPGLADHLRLRDQGSCRTPWCDAPIRHTDHITPVADGGTTHADNLQGLCEACNHTKQAPGWHQHVIDDQQRHTVETTTPTGHHYRSRAPSPPTPARRKHPARLDAYFLDLELSYAA